MAQHHFLVVYDTETKTWIRDDDTLEVVLAGGPIYDPKSDEWREPKNEQEFELDRLIGENLDDRLA